MNGKLDYAKNGIIQKLFCPEELLPTEKQARPNKWNAPA